MKSIIKSIFILTVLFSIVFILNKSLQDSIVSNGLKLGSSDKIIILGDSHGVCSFNPKYISNAKNYSNYGESLIFSYYKLLQILENNPDKKDLKVLISLSYHSIHKCRENYKDIDERAGIIQAYYPLLDEDGLDLIGRNGMEYYLTKLKFDFGVPFKFKTSINSLLTKKPHFVTGYKADKISREVNLEHARKKFNDHYNDETEPVVSPVLVQYLDKIIELTNKYDFELVFINTPKHKLYLSNSVPSNVPKEYHRIVDSLSGNSSNLHFFDFSTLLTEKDLFRDTDHLNSLGAKMFSIKVDSCLNAMPS